MCWIFGFVWYVCLNSMFCLIVGWFCCLVRVGYRCLLNVWVLMVGWICCFRIICEVFICLICFILLVVRICVVVCFVWLMWYWNVLSRLIIISVIFVLMWWLMKFRLMFSFLVNVFFVCCLVCGVVLFLSNLLCLVWCGFGWLG